MNGHLHVHLVSDAEAVVDRGRSGSPVLVQLEAHRTGLDLLAQRCRKTRVSLAQKAEIHRECISGLEHGLHMPDTRGASGCAGTGRRAGSSADHGSDSGHERFFDLLRADEMDMAVNAARRDDHPLASDDFGAGADRYRHVGLNVGVARLANGADAAVLDSNVRLDDSPPVDDEGVGDDGIGYVGIHALALTHSIANHLAATKLDLLAVRGEVDLDLDP